jgi:hypothetical protein
MVEDALQLCEQDTVKKMAQYMVNHMSHLPEDLRTEQEFILLCTACRHGRTDMVRYFFSIWTREHTQHLLKRVHGFTTPLHEACYGMSFRDNQDVLFFILFRACTREEAYVLLNLRNFAGQTPFMLLSGRAPYMHEDSVRMIMDAWKPGTEEGDALMRTTDVRGYTVIHELIRSVACCATDKNMSLFHRLFRDWTTPEMQFDLLTTPCKDKRRTPVHFLCMYGCQILWNFLFFETCAPSKTQTSKTSDPVFRTWAKEEFIRLFELKDAEGCTPLDLCSLIRWDEQRDEQKQWEEEMQQRFQTLAFPTRNWNQTDDATEEEDDHQKEEDDDWECMRQWRRKLVQTSCKPTFNAIPYSHYSFSSYKYRLIRTLVPWEHYAIDTRSFPICSRDQFSQRFGMQYSRRGGGLETSAPKKVDELVKHVRQSKRQWNAREFRMRQSTIQRVFAHVRVLDG